MNSFQLSESETNTFNLISEKDEKGNNILAIAIRFCKYNKFVTLLDIISKDKRLLYNMLTAWNYKKENVLNVLANVQTSCSIYSMYHHFCVPIIALLTSYMHVEITLWNFFIPV